MERKRTEETLCHSREVLQAVLDTIPVRVFWKDVNLKYLGANAAFAQDAGFARAEDIIGHDDYSMAWRDQAELYRNDDKKVIESGTDKIQYEEIQTTPTGGTIHLLTSKVPLRDDHGDVFGVLGTYLDITERKKVEQALQASEERFEKILSQVPVGIVIVGYDRRARWVNRHALEITGFTREEIIGERCNEYMCPAKNDACPILDLHQVVDKSERWLKCRDGSLRPILKSVFNIVFDEEQALLETFVDMTDHKRIENELSHARKLEAVGQLAAGIAHEINTPTQFVSDSVHFLKEVCDSQRELIGNYRLFVDAVGRQSGHEELVARIREAEQKADIDYSMKHVPGAFERCFDGLGRIATIVGAMKEFAHPDQKEMAPADLNQALQATLTIARNEYKYVADVETELGEIPPVKCHVGELNQVFLNLLVNAAHAIADVVGDGGARGTIRVRTRAEGDHALIEIEDTGTGIPETIRDRIFDPFFTTKEVGKGSGQGLAIAHSVVTKKHGGTLTFRTREGQGTTFIIRIPVDGNGTRGGHS